MFTQALLYKQREFVAVFGESHAAETAEKHGTKLLGSIPMDTRLSEACDRGLIELFEGDWLDDAIRKLLQ